MFNHESKQSNRKILQIDLSNVTLSDGHSFQVVESTTEILDRINSHADYIRLCEFVNLDHVKHLLIRTSLINIAETDHATYICDNEDKLHEMVHRYNQTIKRAGTKRGGIEYGKQL